MAQRNQAADAQELYDNRAENYDASWHKRFSSHIAQLLDLQPGDHVLDLACGTGLVTFEAAKRVGASGRVVGIDISTGMLAQANLKLKSHAFNNVEFHTHSITELGTLAELRERSFDAITCASALVLLPDAKAALSQWTKYLKPGGRLITDATHPRTLLPGIVLGRVGRALNLPVPSYREPFQKPEDLAEFMHATGLVGVEVKRMSQLASQDGSDGLPSFLRGSSEPLVARTYVLADAASVFDNQIKSPFGASMAIETIRAKAKVLFEAEWSKLADDDGSVVEIDEVFVGLGWKAKL